MESLSDNELRKYMRTPEKERRLIKAKKKAMQKLFEKKIAKKELKLKKLKEKEEKEEKIRKRKKEKEEEERRQAELMPSEDDGLKNWTRNELKNELSKEQLRQCCKDRGLNWMGEDKNEMAKRLIWWSDVTDGGGHEISNVPACWTKKY